MADNPFKVVLDGAHKISYVHIKEPTSFEDGPKKYSCTFLIPKDHPDVRKIKDAINAMYLANKDSKFGGLPIKSPKLWNPLRDGEEWLEEHPEAVEYEGCYFLKASSTSQPKVFGTDKQEILDLDEELYSGCYCRAVLAGFAFNNKMKGFGFFLNSLMKIKDGVRIGGFTASADDYGDVPSKGKARKDLPSTNEDDDLL